ncbi:MAG TPA: alpha-amylase family protein [Acidobacteriaceae bacterium]|nr:alpha-amylase family protein [Acidobacteriaceae bacterium]
MRRLSFALLVAVFSASALHAKVVVFAESGFPVVSSQPVSRETLAAALGPDATFAGIEELSKPQTLHGASLLVLPYGSALPVDAWDAIEAYLHSGGNLLVLGGQPLRVPVTGHAGDFHERYPQDTYARSLDFRNTYEVPAVDAKSTFAWRDGYSFLPRLSIRAQHFFAVEGHLDGLGYMIDGTGDKVAAPMIVADYGASRIVALDFDPAPGYWESADGTSLIRAAAAYTEGGPTKFWIEEQYCALRPGETPLLTLHLRRTQSNAHADGQVQVELVSNGKAIDSATVPLAGAEADAEVPFRKPLPMGFYAVRATLMIDGQPREAYSNGFFVEDPSALDTGAALGVDGNFLTRGGKPFFPVGTNYFSTEADGWDFSGPRNAQVWEDDFADMERHGVSFVRTGVWMPNAKFVEPSTGEANERFLRNVEAFLAAAQRHHIAVNFTFFAFSPHSGETSRRANAGAEATPPNPYLNPGIVRAEQAYVLSVVRRFAHVPFLSYDLINEPSFSNPRLIFHGNVPNGDPSEVAAWHTWLREKYSNIDALAAAWSVPASQLGAFDNVPLPEPADLNYDRYRNAHEVRALDYNLFAQDMFAQWVHGMVEAIRGAGSAQLINVGQDEGSVTNRVLNQFYATSGVSFTTNHTYWQDDALLWDSVAAKHVGIPNITGETGYQPVWAPDGTWRYDELTGTGLEERKWALGFAAGSSGAMQWDWDREVDFGIERSDGSAKVWENMMRDLGHFAEQAAPYATGLTLPEVAIVLPQSLQLSVYNSEAIEAQQTAVRVLYNYNRTPAYAVGEYQIATLGSPKLIILPSAYGLTDAAWQALAAHVRDGAVLLISGPFAADAHLHPTDRAAQAGLGYETVPLELRNQTFTWAGQPLPLTFGGQKTTVLSRAELPGNKDWGEVTLGKGRILFSALPLELNDRLDSVAAVYAYAIHAAGIAPTFTTTTTDPGILICPTLLPHATLYVLASETNQTDVSFRDQRSGKTFTGTLDPGRASLLLVGEDGTLIANYRWHGN